MSDTEDRDEAEVTFLLLLSVAMKEDWGRGCGVSCAAPVPGFIYLFIYFFNLKKILLKDG